MTLSNYVSITITRDSVGVARAGFGVPLLLGGPTAWLERVRSYNSLTDVVADFATTTVEYKAAEKLFGQSPKLETLKIARSALPPTQRYTLSIGTPVNSHTYTINVVGEGFSGTASFTSDASATDGEIVVGLVAALNGISGNNYIAAGTTSPFTVTADNPGDWFSLEIVNADIPNMTISQNHADPGVATDLANISLEDDDWYALYTVFNSKAYVGAAAAAINAQKKIYLFDANDTTCATVAVASADDTFEDVFDLGYTRVSGWYHPDPSDFLAASVLGRCLPLDPGAVTFALKTLSGTEVVSRTATHRQNILARKANSYERVSGRNVTYNGTVASGEFIDVIRDLDFVEDDIGASIFEVLADADKVPFTDEGIALVEGALRAAMARAEAAKIFAPGWTVTVPKAADVSTANKGTRTLPDVKFSATLAGAIHKTEVTGVVSV